MFQNLNRTRIGDFKKFVVKVGCAQICRHHFNFAGTVVNGFHNLICSLLFISALIKGDHRFIPHRVSLQIRTLRSQMY